MGLGNQSESWKILSKKFTNVDYQASFVAGHVKHFLNEWTNTSEILTFYSAYLVALLNLIRSHFACQCLYA